MYGHPYLKIQSIKNLAIISSIVMGVVLLTSGIFSNIIFGLILIGISIFVIKVRKDNKTKISQRIFEKTNQNPLYITESFLVENDEKGYIAILKDQFVFFTKNTGYSFPFQELQDFGMISQDTGNSVSTVSESFFDNDKIHIKTKNIMLETFAILGEKDGSEYLKQFIIMEKGKFLGKLNMMGMLEQKNDLDKHSI